MGIFDGGRKLREATAALETATAQITALAGEVASLREDVSLYDPDAGLSATGGGSLYFRRLSAVQRDLEPMKHEQMLKIAYYLYDFNPLAIRVLELTRDFIVGEGITVISQAESETEQEAQQEAIDRFWNDPINRWDLTLPNKVLELGLAGNQCYPVTVNPVDGSVRVGYIDPGEITGVLTDPNDATLPVVVCCKKPGNVTEKRYFRVIHMDLQPESPTFGRLIGALPDEPLTVNGEAHTYEGSCFYFAVNKVSNASLGRSDLLPLADWIDGHDQFLMSELDRVLLMKSFIWDVTHTGLDEAQIAAEAKKTPSPKPGTVRHHNEKVVWQQVTPDLKALDSQVTGDMLISQVAMGSGLPKTWLAGVMDVNKATAQELGEPSFKRLTARQKYVRYMVEHMIRFVLDQAEIRGLLTREMDGMWPEPWPIAVQAPEMRSKDLKSIADTLNTATTALAAAQSSGLIDEATAQELVVLLVGQFGIEVDIEKMRAAIEKEKAEAELDPYSAPPTDPNDPRMLTLVNGARKGGGEPNGRNGVGGRGN